MRSIYCLISLLLCLQLSALESPLIVQGQGDLTAVINPNAGTIQLYRTAGQRLVQTGSYYFLSDLDFLANKPHPQIDPEKTPDADKWTLLRVGLQTKPNLLNNLRENNREAWDVTMASEREFWDQVPTYQGNVMGAIGINHLYLLIPEMHALLAYEVRNGSEVNLVAARNIGPDLMVNGTINSRPNPTELLRDLPEEVQEAYREKMEAQKEAIEAGQVVELKEPKPWVQSLQNDKIVVLEPANQMLLVYEYRSKYLELKSARSLEIELMVPPKASVNTTPEPERMYKAYLKQLQRAKITPYAFDELEALVSVSGNFRKEGGQDEIQASIDENYNLVIDFVKARKLMLYSPDEGGGGIVLYSVRDYTLENAIALHMDQINNHRRAEGIYKEAEGLARKRSQRPKAMRLLKMALDYKPALVEDAEDDLARRLSDEPGWADLIKNARAAWAEEQQQEEARKNALEKMRNQKR